MKSTHELDAEIVRLHYAENWPVGTIATQLETHPDQVRRVLGLGAACPPSHLRARIVDPYRPFIDETLHRYPKLLATRQSGRPSNHDGNRSPLTTMPPSNSGGSVHAVRESIGTRTALRGRRPPSPVASTRTRREIPLWAAGLPPRDKG